MEEELTEVILWHSRAYPHMKPADYVKLLYQNEFGCSHFLKDPGQSLDRLKEEFFSLPAPKGNTGRGPRMEPIGNELCRVFLEPGQQTEEFLPLLNRMQSATARTYEGNRMRFQKKLSLLRNMAAKGQLTVGGEEMDAFLSRYVSSGCEPIGHSPEYQKYYSPHYRVAKAAYYAYLPVFRAVMKLTASHNVNARRPVLLALDGRCGSGKSYLAGLLREVFGCNVFHIDDFYVPQERRDADWMKQPGGNIDRERLLKEVLQPLREGRKVVYCPYSCQKGAMLPPVEAEPKPLAVVEGSYCLHPDFRNFFDYRVFLTCLPNVQQRRIFLRGDGKRLHDFLEKWIPAEERYLEEMKIGDFCDLALDTSGFEDFA
ncbi:uridine kinase family protein [Caproicibacter fermentans]|uniref:Uridine kinase n=1 Tax=Caproicibacter fermentans TaxID=2576756 RepID=A0A7G8T6K1_9FIRM|nr:hypothetical protein [Caproicibacter fermentans]QNK39242.1 hypothetical protein HCR03_10720 [Caproicibacter fermentans]